MAKKKVSPRPPARIAAAVIRNQAPAQQQVEILKLSRRVVFLERRSRELNRQLREAAAELRHVRRTLRAVVQDFTEPDPMSPPMRLFGETAEPK